MKIHRACVLFTILLVLLPSAAFAQQPPSPDGGWQPPYVSQGSPPDGPPPPGGGRGGPGGPGGGPGGPGPQGPVTPEMEAQFLAFMKQNDPASVEDLSRLKSQDPQHYQRVVAEGLQRMRFLEMTKKTDRAAYDGLMQEFRLDATSRRLVREYRDGPADKKAAVKKQLETVLSQLFDLRESNRKRQIERLEKQLAELKATTQARGKNKSSIVQRRLEDLLADPSTSW